ncbi:hypothetical protein [Shimia thalassica]|uniref:hypothetical protein n=1 Tax=Shimia thalassica TaxID=1715693 RepID=UPI0026E45F0E|nr:hypothetical protein [Shimia thalassica]MDO6482708.1 hypothetical protein [Shimia thalassica]
MTSSSETTKTHYICQTYVTTKAGRNGVEGLKIEKQLQYTSAAQAQERAEREARADGCAGADAYEVEEDLNSGEVGPPNFLVRIGNVPEFDDF